VVFLLKYAENLFNSQRTEQKMKTQLIQVRIQQVRSLHTTR
jgi:hypothetical protein